MKQTGFPLFLDNSPSGISEQILFLVKNSNLNFNVQETAFSLNISIKKHFIKRWSRHDMSDQTSNIGTSDVLSDLEAKDGKILELERNIELLKDHIRNSDPEKDPSLANKLKAVNNEKKSLQLKHEKVCAEQKDVKAENEDLTREVKIAQVAIKSSIKASKDTSHQHEKEVNWLL